MAHVLSLSLRLFRLAAEERRQRREAEMQSELNQRLLDSLQERQELLERLARIQRSITHGAVREDVLDAICLGARELLGDEVAGLQLVPPDDPDVLEIVAMRGRDALELRGARTGPRRGHRLARHGGGPPDRLRGLPERRGRLEACSRERGIRAGMAAPVHESGRPVGSLVVASYDSGRRYSSIERDMLLAFADHASLALSDARSIQAMREADAARIQARFRSLVNSSSDMITVIDSGGQIVFASPSVERALVLPESGYDGTPLELLIHPDDRALAIEFIAAVARDNAPGKPVEWRMRAADGTWMEVETTATGQLDDPDVQGIVLNSRNVTERKRLEAQLRQSQRLESVGPARRRDRARLQQLPVGDPRLRALPDRGDGRGGAAPLRRPRDREGRRARLAADEPAARVQPQRGGAAARHRPGRGARRAHVACSTGRSARTSRSRPTWSARCGAWRPTRRRWSRCSSTSW